MVCDLTTLWHLICCSVIIGLGISSLIDIPDFTYWSINMLYFTHSNNTSWYCVLFIFWACLFPLLCIKVVKYESARQSRLCYQLASLYCQEEVRNKLTCWIILNSIPLNIICLMETRVFPKDRALVNVQVWSFCVHLNAKDNIFAT